MPIQMGFLNCNIELNPVIVSISHTKYLIKPPKQEEGFVLGEIELEDELDYVVEKKDIFISLNIKIEQSEWNIPYLVVLRKYKNDFIKGDTTNYPKIKKFEDEDSFLYLMDRYINIPFFEIKYQNNMDVLIDILLILSSTNFRKNIYKCQYMDIIPNLFFMKNDKVNLENQGRLKYCIRKYYYIANNSFEWMKNRSVVDYRIAPHINLKKFITNQERILSGEHYKTKELNNYCSFNLVPYNYASTYAKSFNNVYPLTYYKTENSYDRNSYKIACFGTHEECKKIILDDNKFDSLKKKIFEEEKNASRRKTANESFDESDYFDAMTDGQLGLYDDYEGDIDGIDTWSRG